MNIKELICFYSGIFEDNFKDRFPITYEFSEKHPATGEYYKLAKLFESAGKESVKDEYDMKFYVYLKKLNVTDKYFFNDGLVANVDIFSPFINYEKKIISQKWHLLISIYAYLDVVNNKMAWKQSKIYKHREIDFYKEFISGTESKWKLIEEPYGYSCNALKLWMAEAAGVKKLEQYIHNGSQVKIPWNIVEKQIEVKMIQNEIF